MTRVFWHKEAAAGAWARFSLEEQMANIGSEIGRATKWQDENTSLFRGAVERALELFDLTLDDPRWKGKNNEIALAKEVFCDAVLGGKEYKESLPALEKYFLPFAFAARRHLT
ncbi:MAG: hypothetical protein Q7S62_00165 [bacterium]|nr:hypothetical protein [bacterium]